MQSASARLLDWFANQQDCTVRELGRIAFDEDAREAFVIRGHQRGLYSHTAAGAPVPGTSGDARGRRSFAKRRLELEQFCVALMVEAGDFYQAPQPSGTWKYMQSPVPMSNTLAHMTHHAWVSRLLRSAAAAALSACGDRRHSRCGTAVGGGLQALVSCEPSSYFHRLAWHVVGGVIQDWDEVAYKQTGFSRWSRTRAAHRGPRQSPHPRCRGDGIGLA
ncbi:hypothetical protein LX36DRAFT_499215 [Colletotrichum falcatum]|nr:hypothetical protein LX36DRAFT_499215 [Colletotrichum falcatum]